MTCCCCFIENNVLYQNYKEKALDIDSDEESEPREQKSDEKVVFHYKPLRSTWSQLSVVSIKSLHSQPNSVCDCTETSLFTCYWNIQLKFFFFFSPCKIQGGSLTNTRYSGYSFSNRFATAQMLLIKILGSQFSFYWGFM